MLSVSAIGQNSIPPSGAVSNAEAKDNFTNGNWKAAMKEYLGLIATDSSNSKYSYRIGICYLETFMNKQKAVYFLEKAVRDGSTEKDVLFMLGKAYHQNMQFDKAVETYRKAIAGSGDKKLSDRATRYIAMAENAKQIIQDPVKGIKIENLGADVNSEDPDYLPFIDEDETTLMFNTKRAKGNSGYIMDDGLFTIDIFVSKEKSGGWTKPRNIGGAVGNTADDEIVGFAPDGSYLFTNLLTVDVYNDILGAAEKGKTFDKPTQLMPPVNQFETKEYSAALSPDKQILYFCSDRPGGLGGMDIYRSRLLPDGNWAEAENMGPGINTEWDELFPHVTGSGKWFYFASEGHTSIGGFDIFKCAWDQEKDGWGAAQNLGYPINTPFDDMRIALSKNERVGYIATHRDDAIGDLDIYSVTFLSVEERNTAMTGVINYLAPIDYNEYDEFFYYKNGEAVKRFPKSYVPPAPEWEFVESKRVPSKPGIVTKYSLTFEKDGVAKQYALEKAPIKDTTYHFKDIKVQQIPNPAAKPPPKNRATQTEVIVPEATITVHDAITGDLVGKYQPAPRTGKYVIIAPPGSYKMKIEAEGFKKFEDTFHIIGKGSFKDEVERKINLIPEKEPAAVHFTEIPKEKK